MRLIDADALKPDYYDEYVVGDDEYVVRYYSETQIDNAPSIDIVRCGECKYACHYTDGHMECRLIANLSPAPMCYQKVEADDYCSYGERKTDD